MYAANWPVLENTSLNLWIEILNSDCSVLSEVKADENYFRWRWLSAAQCSSGQAIFIEEREEARRLFTKAHTSTRDDSSILHHTEETWIEILRKWKGRLSWWEREFHLFRNCATTASAYIKDPLKLYHKRISILWNWILFFDIYFLSINVSEINSKSFSYPII